MRMLKWRLLLTVLCYSLSVICLAQTSPTTPEASSSATAKPAPANKSTLKRVGYQNTDPQEAYTITINYPQVNNFKNGDAYNNLIKQTVEGIIAEFKKNVRQGKTISAVTYLPHDENANTLTLNYKVMLATPDLLSIRFSIDTYFYGAAHPNIAFQSIVYDFLSGKTLSLSDVFNNANYLDLLSKSVKPILTQKLSASAQGNVEPDAAGIKPVPENYKVWNLTPQGLLITFPAYQVAAYAFGPQEVLIPYSILQDQLQANLLTRLKRIQ